MIFLIRHGSVRKRKGDDEWSKVPLNSKGIFESNSIADYLFLKNKVYSGIYTSDILRASQTAKILSKKLHTKIIPLKQIREFHLNCKNPEKLSHMQNRIKKFVLSDKFSSNKKIIVVTHKGIIREILIQTKQYKNPFRLKIEPSSIFLITKNKKCRKISFCI